MPQVVVPMIVAFVVSVITQVAMKLLTPKPKKPGLQYYGNYSGTAEPVRLIYGRVRVGGMQVIPPFTTNKEGKALHMVIAYCAHEIEQYAMHYFDNAAIDPSDIAPTIGVISDGQVTAGTYREKANIRPYLGTSTQTADYILRTRYPGAFDTDFRGRGIAYVAYTLWFGNQYKSVPQLGALVYGKKCYDPRTGTTPSTATSNPALILRDYLVNEVGFPSAAVDDALVQAAANICDQLVDIPPGPSTQQKRYQCNVLLSAGDNWEDNVRMILATMRGIALYRDGVWRIYAGAWDTPTVTITADAWVSPTTVNISSPMEERWNAVTGWYMAADKAYQRTPCFPRRNTTYETQDGGEQFMQDLELHGVTDEYEAQRHAEFELRRSRNQLTISGRLRPEYIKLATWDTVYVTDEYYGWSNKTFRVISMEMAPDGTVDVNLQEEGSATWTDLARSEYGAITTVPTIDPGASLPEARTNFAIEPVINGINFSWDPMSEAMPEEMTRILEGTVSSDATFATEIWRGSANKTSLQFTSAVTKAYWIQGVVDSYVGPYTPSTFGTWACPSSGSNFGAPNISELPNGYFTSLDVNSRCAGWDWKDTTASTHAAAGGVSSEQCFVAGSYASSLIYMNKSAISIVPNDDALDIEVWIRAVTSGQQVYLCMEALDVNSDTITPARDSLLGVVYPPSAVSSGALTVTVAKPNSPVAAAGSTCDFSFSGYANSFNYLVLGVSSGGQHWFPRTQPPASASYLISSINSASNGSLDTLTLATSLFRNLTAMEPVGVGNWAASTSYRYPNGAAITVTSAWQKYRWSINGQTVPWKRFGTPDPNTFPIGTRAVRLGFARLTGAVNAEFRVSQYSVKRRDVIAGTLVFDTAGRSSGGAVAWPFDGSRTLKTRASFVNSGFTLGGALLFSAGSYVQNRVGLWPPDMPPTNTNAADFRPRVRGKVYRYAANSGGKIGVTLGYLVNGEPQFVNTIGIIDLLQTVAGRWSDFEFYGQFVNNSPAYPMVPIAYLDSEIVNSGAMISDLVVEDSLIPIGTVTSYGAGGAPPSGPAATLTAQTVHRTSAAGAQAVATYRVAADGYVYKRVGSLSSPWTQLEQWKTGTGVGSDYEVRAHSVAVPHPLYNATFTGTTAINSWMNCGTDRAWGWLEAESVSSGTINVMIRSAADATTRAWAQIEIDAYSPVGGGGGCPFCCFTPDTLIEMADGTVRPIAAVGAGDWIATAHGSVEVTEVIVRVDRAMYRLEFEDGTVVEASDDHPFYVEGRGYASLNPTAPYKDIGIPDALRVGDRVRRRDGAGTRLLRTSAINYSGKVYTFAETEFFANGLQVY